MTPVKSFTHLPVPAFLLKVKLPKYLSEISSILKLRKSALIFLQILMLSPHAFLVSQEGKKIGNLQTKPLNAAGMPRSALLNINNVSLWASDNGLTERKLQDLSSGVIFPRGTSAIVHAGGLIWGGQVQDGRAPALRVGGQTYNVGTVPGRIVSPGIVESPENSDVRIYRTRRDWATADLSQDAAEYFGIALADVTPLVLGKLREQYRRDWLEWPWQKGAPYYEKNGIPGYQPDSAGSADSSWDEPGLGGADQVLWFVSNDLDNSAVRALYGSPPIGLEMQVSCWAYNHIKNLENVIFERYRLIYKGGPYTPPSAIINPMYLAKWVDPDVGNYSDDFVGCSPASDFAYAYNSAPTDAEYDKYNMTPPVVGYGIMEGPRVQKPGGTARWDLKTISGYINMPMTAFTYFSWSERLTDYTMGSYDGTRQWWNILNGNSASGQCMRDQVTGSCTNFELTGDPESYQGWVDGIQQGAGDRRMALVTGPFSLAFGDTQEVVIGLVAGAGKDNRSGITAVKKMYGAAHDAYNLNFDFPEAMPIAHLRIVELDQKLILDWESDTSQIKKVESYRSRGYKFETYTVYQFPLPTSTIEDAVIYQNFDPAQQRYIYVTTDKIRNRPLVNGQKYYFAVTSSAYNPDEAFVNRRIESPFLLQEAVPHSPNPGVVYPYSIKQPLPSAINFVGINDAVVHAEYYDPSRADGHTYKLIFRRFTDPLKDLDTKPTWDMVDSTMNDTLLKGRPSDGPDEHITTRGFSIRISLPLHGLMGVYQMRYNDQPAYNPVFNEPNPQGNYMIVGGGTSQLDTLKGDQPLDNDMDLRFGVDSSWALFYGITAPASRWVKVPYTAWEIRVKGKDTASVQRYTLITDEGQDSIWRPSVLLDREYNGTTLQVFYPVTMVNDSARIRDTTYVGGTYHDDAPYRPDAAFLKGYLWLNAQSTSKAVAIRKIYIADLDGDGLAVPRGTVIRFIHFKEVRNLDEKLFTPESVKTGDITSAKREVEMVNVFPNPYYGANRAEISRLQKFMTFNHLPWFATIRIFNLSGVLVSTIQKGDETQFATWNLNNESGLQAAGGIYIAHIELKDKSGYDLGTKTLKLMIVPEDQAPERR